MYRLRRNIETQINDKLSLHYRAKPNEKRKAEVKKKKKMTRKKEVK